VRALIVDDERLARAELRRLLQDFPEVEIVGEARNVDEAAREVTRLQPELLFLDIQMPSGDGFELLERLDSVPLVIFTTAYDQYALRAFEVSALDYLLKPISPERLSAAIHKVLARDIEPNAPSPEPSPETSPGPNQSSTNPSQRVFVRDGDHCWFVALEEIVLLESEGNYTRLFFGSHKPLLLRSLNYLQERLDPRLFFRVNRRQVINLKFIEAIDHWPNGGYKVKLRGGFEVTMSRRQAQCFQRTTEL
jgi:two-component system, LytTR family, response regulator